MRRKKRRRGGLGRIDTEDEEDEGARGMEKEEGRREGERMNKLGNGINRKKDKKKQQKGPEEEETE